MKYVTLHAMIHTSTYATKYSSYKQWYMQCERIYECNVISNAIIYATL